MTRTCAVKGCKNYKRSGDFNSNKVVSFHRFPLKNKYILKQWEGATGRRDWIATKSHAMCSDHFTENDFILFDNKTTKRHLLPYSVPSLNLSPKHVISKPLVLDISSDESDSSEDSLSFDHQPEHFSTDVDNNNIEENSSLSQPTCDSVAVECETGPVVEVVSDEVNLEKQSINEDEPSIEVDSEELAISCDKTLKTNKPKQVKESLVIIRLKHKLQTEMHRNNVWRKKYKAIQSVNIRQKRKICALEEKIVCLKRALSKEDQNLFFD